MSQSLPAKPSLVFLKKQAKDLLDAVRSGDPDAVKIVAACFSPAEKIGLAQVHLALAREYGFPSWSSLKRHVAKEESTVVESFIDAAIAGRLEDARQLWNENRELLRQNVASASIAGDVGAVKGIVQGSPSIVNEGVPPKKAPVLCYVCSSRLVADSEFETGILETVAFLLASDADPNSFTWSDWGGEKWRETALYGAAGVLNHAGLTKLLLRAGADPNDGAIDNGVYRGESLYHACDHPGHNECLHLILEAKPAQPALDYCILRKLDFEDIEGVKLFIEHGANLKAAKPRTALSHAILRGRSIEMLKLLLDSGADPNTPDEDGTTAYGLSRRLGNREASALLELYGAVGNFGPHDAILIAAADGDRERVRELSQAHPEILEQMSDLGRQANDGAALGSAGQVLHDMARLGHKVAVEALLDLGWSPGVTNQYNETPLHWACVAGRAEVAELLTSRGAPMDIREKGHHCIPIEWITWGSLNWNEPFGDYGRTIEVMLNAGSPLPRTFEGSEPVLDALRAHGMGGEAGHDAGDGTE